MRVSQPPRSNPTARHLHSVPTQPTEFDFDKFVADVDEFYLPELDLITDSRSAEYFSASLWIGGYMRDMDLNDFMHLWIPACEAIGTSAAAGMLAILAPFSDPEIAEEIAETLNRLAAAGVRPPHWAAGLSVVPTLRNCVEWRPTRTPPMLSAFFDQGTSTEAVLVTLSESGAATSIALSEDGRPEIPIEVLNGTATKVPLSTAEFREQVEYALAVRSADEWTSRDEPPLDHHSYYARAYMLQRRLRQLP